MHPKLHYSLWTKPPYFGGYRNCLIYAIASNSTRSTAGQGVSKGRSSEVIETAEQLLSRDFASSLFSILTIALSFWTSCGVNSNSAKSTLASAWTTSTAARFENLTAIRKCSITAKLSEVSTFLSDKLNFYYCFLKSYCHLAKDWCRTNFIL